MSEETTNSGEPVRVPFMQRVLDNPFILLFIGIVFPTRFLHYLGNHGNREHPDCPVTTRLW